MEGEPLDDEAKILGGFQAQEGYEAMEAHYSNYPTSYSNFRARASDIVHTEELQASRLGGTSKNIEPKKNRRSGRGGGITKPP